MDNLKILKSNKMETLKISFSSHFKLNLQIINNIKLK